MVAPLCKKLIFRVAERGALEKHSELERKVLSAATYGLTRLNSAAAMGILGKSASDAVAGKQCVVLEWTADRKQLPVLSWKYSAALELVIQITIWSLDRNAIGLRFEVGLVEQDKKNPHCYWHCQLFDVYETYGKWPRKRSVTRSCQAFTSYPAIPIPASDATGMVLSALLSLYGQQRLEEIIGSDNALKREVDAIMKTRVTGVGLEMYPGVSL